jgi:hypothetical protein
LNNGIFVSEDKITLKWNDPTWNDARGYYDVETKRYQQTLDPTKAKGFEKAKLDANNIFSDILEWIRTQFSKASEKLRAIAEKILDLLKRFGISIIDVLARMRKFIFRWVITNSALPSVVISDDKASVNLGLSSITTSGSVEFGRVDSNLNIIENIIGILKIIPSISVKIDAVYGCAG